MVNGSIADMRKHMEDYKADIELLKMRPLEEKEMATVIERAIYVWNLSASMQFGFTLQEVEKYLLDTI